MEHVELIGDTLLSRFVLSSPKMLLMENTAALLRTGSGSAAAAADPKSGLVRFDDVMFVALSGSSIADGDAASRRLSDSIVNKLGYD